MDQINRITSDPYQKHTLVLGDGTTFVMYLYFRPMQQGWFIKQLSYPTQSFVLPELRICVSPNMLYQWQNLLPFGLACFTNDNREPSLQEDFVTGSAKLYILSETEVAEYSSYIRNG